MQTKPQETLMRDVCWTWIAVWTGTVLCGISWPASVWTLIGNAGNEADAGRPTLQNHRDLFFVLLFLAEMFGRWRFFEIHQWSYPVPRPTIFDHKLLRISRCGPANLLKTDQDNFA
jgi:hypothetical protein